MRGKRDVLVGCNRINDALDESLRNVQLIVPTPAGGRKFTEEPEVPQDPAPAGAFLFLDAFGRVHRTVRFVHQKVPTCQQSWLQSPCPEVSPRPSSVLHWALQQVEEQRERAPARRGGEGKGPEGGNNTWEARDESKIVGETDLQSLFFTHTSFELKYSNVF